MTIQHKRGCGVREADDHRIVLQESPERVFRLFCTACSRFSSPFDAPDRDAAVERVNERKAC